MRKSKFSESQIVAILKECEAGMPVAELDADPAAEHRGLTAIYVARGLEPALAVQAAPAAQACGSVHGGSPSGVPWRWRSPRVWGRCSVRSSDPPMPGTAAPASVAQHGA